MQGAASTACAAACAAAAAAAAAAVLPPAEPAEPHVYPSCEVARYIPLHLPYAFPISPYISPAEPHVYPSWEVARCRHGCSMTLTALLVRARVRFGLG